MVKFGRVHNLLKKLGLELSLHLSSKAGNVIVFLKMVNNLQTRYDSLIGF
jgi:hypothetical protein